jgi:hypothetical protein
MRHPSQLPIHRNPAQELDRIARELVEQNTELELATAILRDHPDAEFSVDSAQLDELRGDSSTADPTSWHGEPKDTERAPLIGHRVITLGGARC